MNHKVNIADYLATSKSTKNYLVNSELQSDGPSWVVFVVLQNRVMSPVCKTVGSLRQGIVRKEYALTILKADVTASRSEDREVCLKESRLCRKTQARRSSSQEVTCRVYMPGTFLQHKFAPQWVPVLKTAVLQGSRYRPPPFLIETIVY